MAENTHEIKIAIKGDASSAVGALGRVKAAVGGVIGVLNTVKSAVGKVMSALGVIGMAMQGVQLVIDGWKKLHEWLNRAETAAKALREEIAKANYAAAVSRASEAYKKLNEELAETLRLERERSKILADRKATERDLEDADSERRKQLEISRLDPSAENYADRKKEIERRYAIAASDTKAARAREDNSAAAKELYDQAAGKDSEAARLQKLYLMKRRDAKVAEWNAQKFRIESDEKDDAADRKAKEWSEEFKEASKAAAAFREKMIAARKEAASLRRMAGEKAGGGLAANIRNAAEKTAIENAARADAAEKEKKSAEKSAEEKRRADEEARRQSDEKAKREQNLEDAKLALQKEKDLAALDPSDPDYDRKKKEIEYLYESKAAEDKVSRATSEEDRQAAEAERDATFIRHDRERGEARQARADEYGDRLAGLADSSRPKDRLTAMGLGSGAAIDRTAQEQAKDVKTLVGLVKEQIQLARENNQVNTAVYAP